MGYKKGSAGLGLGNIAGDGLSTHNSSILTSKMLAQSEYFQFEYAEVIEIDLNPEKPEHVGRIKFRTVNKSGLDIYDWAVPLMPHYRMYPVIGELVVVVTFDERYYWLSILNALNMANNNLQRNITERNIKVNGVSNVSEYKEVQSFGIAINEDEKNGSPGDTFKNQRMKVGLLYPNEGDVIIEGRFGNSIRLGNNPDSNSPNIKISVRDLLDKFSIDNENIDEDSCIFITTDEILTFNPVGIPINDVNNPPSEYGGKQILITSDRLIFTSKLNEILMFSNKTISFASSDNFSIDTDKKIVTNAAQNIEMNTQQEFLVKSEKEAKINALKVMIGNINADEPLVLGNKWKEAMLTLIDIIMNHVHPTGTGPSGTLLTPQLEKLTNLKNSISKKEQLSDDNFTTKKNK